MSLPHTPIEEHDGVLVKRDDYCHRVGTSKMRGILAHLEARPTESTIGVVVTRHTANGYAVAAACEELGRRCVIFFPTYKGFPPEPQPPQVAAERDFGASLVPLAGARQSIMTSRARTTCPEAYMMPVALKLEETKDEAEAEARWTLEQVPHVRRIIVPVGTGTHLLGIERAAGERQVVGVMAYGQGRNIKRKLTGYTILIPSEDDYGDAGGIDPPFPASEKYEWKAWEWAMENPDLRPTLFWNIGR